MLEVVKTNINQVLFEVIFFTHVQINAVVIKCALLWLLLYFGDISYIAFIWLNKKHRGIFLMRVYIFNQNYIIFYLEFLTLKNKQINIYLLRTFTIYKNQKIKIKVNLSNNHFHYFNL